MASESLAKKFSVISFVGKGPSSRDHLVEEGKIDERMIYALFNNLIFNWYIYICEGMYVKREIYQLFTQ